GEQGGVDAASLLVPPPLLLKGAGLIHPFFFLNPPLVSLDSRANSHNSLHHLGFDVVVPRAPRLVWFQSNPSRVNAASMYVKYAWGSARVSNSWAVMCAMTSASSLSRARKPVP